MQNENEPLLKAFFRNKWIRAILILNIIAIIVVIYLFIRQSARNSIIDFNIAPIDAKISVNGDTNYANGQYSIEPGKYEIKISHDGLETKTFNIDIDARSFTTIVAFLSASNNDFEFYKLKDNYASYQKLKSIASAENNMTTDSDTSAQDFIADFDRAISITSKLPIKGYAKAGSPYGGFAIRNGSTEKECEKTTCLLVNYYGKDYEDVVAEKIKEAGYNPGDYQLIYKRYKK